MLNDGQRMKFALLGVGEEWDGGGAWAHTKAVVAHNEDELVIVPSQHAREEVRPLHCVLSVARGN